MEKRKIILVDDKPVYRKAMRDRLSKLGNVEIIAEANNGEEFLEILPAKKPDIIFMDIEMPAMNGIEATQKALKKYPNLVIIGLSMYDNEKYIDELINAGARGYLLKLSSNTKILKTILEYPKAEIFFSKEIEEKKSKPGATTDTILIVDDFEANTYAIGFSLKNAGYQVVEANSGKEALEKIKKNNVNLIITDYKMPNMNGVELIKEIRKIPEYKKTPILVLSSEKGEKEKQMAREAGITGWIQKPFELKRFITIVKKALK